MPSVLRRRKYRILLLILTVGGLFLCFQLFSYKILNLNSRQDARRNQNVPNHIDDGLRHGGEMDSLKHHIFRGDKNVEEVEIHDPKIQQSEDEMDDGQTDFPLLRGVHPSQARLYRERDSGMFQCVKSKTLIPFANVNDDYCDCDDFSDEPGTAACQDSRFYCTFQMPEKDPLFTLGSRVNDGICDCCDGSDEWAGVKVSSGIHITDQKYRANHSPCQNTCQAMEEENKEDRRIRELGRKLKVTYLTAGKKAPDADLYGPKGVFYQLSMSCFDYETEEYKYSICPFKSVTQQKFPNVATNLGKKPVWTSVSHGKYILHMEKGDMSVCPGGKMRSTIITFICGLQDRVLQLSEEEKCVYGVKLSTPAAC